MNQPQLYKNNIVKASTACEALHDYVDESIYHEIKYRKPLIEFVQEIINRKKRRNSPSYEFVYTTLVYHLKRFCDHTGTFLFVESVSDRFIDDFIIYLEDQNLKSGYIKHLLTLLRAMVTKAAKYGYMVNPTFDDVDYDADEPFAISLSANQIARIYYYPNLTRLQEQTRDLFIIGCTTALRYSDYSTLTMNNIRDGYLRKKTKKTGADVVMPCHEFLTEIVKKYNGFPPATTNQNFNRQIKIICKKIGLDDAITITYTKGGKIVSETKPMWQFVGSHTARRSAATNMYLSGRFKIEQIMSYTGHTTEKSLRRYLKVTNEDMAQLMSGDHFWKK